MARMLVLLALCLLPALATAGNPFQVRGCVYCDTCRAGFETEATTYIPDATVRIECKDINTMEVKYSIEGKTDSTGTYTITVAEDRGDDICDVVLVSSPQSDCAEPNIGRDCTRVILTRYNGIITDDRFANAMGFLRKEPMNGCAEILQKYIDTEDAY